MTERNRIGWMIVRFNQATKEETVEKVFIGDDAARQRDEYARQLSTQGIDPRSEVMIVHQINWIEGAWRETAAEIKEGK